ncbi:MAG: L,D-transpeptidase family protein [Hyphomicrobiaceae bacterium]
MLAARMLKLALAVPLAASLWLASKASALEIVLHDVAADRIERQRAFIRNQLPLPGTPELANLDKRMEALGLKRGDAIFIRVFKASSELELWMQNRTGTFTLLATFPICHWTGTLGPKLREGDKQSPEGFYSIGWPQTRLVGHWRKAFNLGFPNRFDQRLDRTGSYILIHGGCSSVGCYAMTNQVQAEIYSLASAALKNGEKRFHVHIFPFRMTAENMARYAGNPWMRAWADLKPAYDSFERTHVPPRIAICGTRYQVADGLPGETGGDDRRLPVLRGGGRQQVHEAAAIPFDMSRWSPPSCEMEDADRRRAVLAAQARAIAGPPVTAAATAQTTIASPHEPDQDARSVIVTGTVASTSAEIESGTTIPPVPQEQQVVPIPRQPHIKPVVHKPTVGNPGARKPLVRTTVARPNRVAREEDDDARTEKRPAKSHRAVARAKPQPSRQQVRRVSRNRQTAPRRAGTMDMYGRNGFGNALRNDGLPLVAGN